PLVPLSVPCTAPPRHPHSFPTRRSSDLLSSATQDSLLHHAAQHLSVVLAQTGKREDSVGVEVQQPRFVAALEALQVAGTEQPARDRKSTRLNSSHVKISYAVFCLKKKSK